MPCCRDFVSVNLHNKLIISSHDIMIRSPCGVLCCDWLATVVGNLSQLADWRMIRHLKIDVLRQTANR